MPFNFKKLNNSFIWISAGLLVGGGIGTGIAFLVLKLHDKNDGKNFGQILWSPETNNEVAPFSIVEMDSTVKDRQSVFAEHAFDIMPGYKDAAGNEVKKIDLGMKTLIYKINSRLGFGPEAAMLKGVTITGDGYWDDANGVYFGGTDQIFIKSQNVIDALKKIKESIILTAEEEIEFVAEYIFQIISHEYNHHIAHTYLNSRVDDATIQGHWNKPASTYSKSSSTYENWDKEFYDTFTSTLKYDKNIDQFNTIGRVPDKNGAHSLANQYTPYQLFRLGNDKTFDNLPGFKAGEYSMFGPNGNPYQLFKDQTQLKYYFSMPELFARKMMQATMTSQNGFPTNYPLKITPRPGVTQDDNYYGVDQMIMLGANRATFSTLRTDTKMYADFDGLNSSPYAFFGDYIYNRSDSSNAKTIFNSLLNEMGYSGSNVKDIKNVTSTEQADISHIWWRNDEKVDPAGSLIYPKQTTSFNMGGYINDDTLNSIGYLDANGEYVELSSIDVHKFDLGIKKEVFSAEKDYADGHIPVTLSSNATQGTVGPSVTSTKDSFYWTLSGYRDINNFTNKDLVFAHKRPSTEIDKIYQHLVNVERKKIKSSQYKTKSIGVVDRSKIAIFGNITPLNSFNSEATSWVSLSSSGNRTGINTDIAFPTYSNTGIRIEVK